MCDVAAAPERVQAFVGQWDLAGREIGEQCLHFGGALPGENALRPVHCAKDINERFHARRIGRIVKQQGSQIVAQRTASALAISVRFGFDSAPLADVIARDSCAGQTHRSGIGSVAATGQDTLVSAIWADAVVAHCGVKAAVAQLIAGPVDT